MAAAQPPTGVVTHLYAIVMTCGIVFSALTFAMTLQFPLTEAKMLEVRKQLDAGRTQTDAGASPGEH